MRSCREKSRNLGLCEFDAFLDVYLSDFVLLGIQNNWTTGYDCRRSQLIKEEIKGEPRNLIWEVNEASQYSIDKNWNSFWMDLDLPQVCFKSYRTAAFAPVSHCESTCIITEIKVWFFLFFVHVDCKYT